MSKTEEYISKALAGEKEAYANLYKLSFRGSYYIAIRLLGNEQDAFSAVQYAFSKAFSSLPRLKVPASFDVWVKQLTAKYCCDVLRSKDADIF
jgi:RNA polymerase sigma-70 factor (ECF subfamily)